MSKNVFWIAVFLLVMSTSHAAISIHPPLSTVDNIQQEDIFFLLAHKWESDNVYLDLKINGTFEAKFDNKTLLYGNWEITPNQETLRLSNDPTDEDTFRLEYTLSEVSYHIIKFIDEQGKEFFLQISQAKG